MFSERRVRPRLEVEVHPRPTAWVAVEAGAASSPSRLRIGRRVRGAGDSTRGATAPRRGAPSAGRPRGCGPRAWPRRSGVVVPRRRAHGGRSGRPAARRAAAKEAPRLEAVDLEARDLVGAGTSGSTSQSRSGATSGSSSASVESSTGGRRHRRLTAGGWTSAVRGVRDGPGGGRLKAVTTRVTRIGSGAGGVRRTRARMAWVRTGTA
jgi:hypothetical protein